MKKLIYTLIFALFTAVNSCTADAKILSSISLVGMSMDYREYDMQGDILDSEKSSLSDLIGYEFSIGFLFNKSSYEYSQIQLKHMKLSGNTEYVGSYLGNGLGYGSVVSSTDNLLIDVDLSYKHTYIFNDFELTYALGIGYYSWERSLSAYQVELYEWFSLRPMVQLGTDVTNKLNIALSLEYQYGFNETMSSSYPPLDFTLGGADIIKVSIPISYEISRDIDLFTEFVFTHQKIEKSGIEYYGGVGYYEPDSTANNQYIKLGAKFKF